jgi:hypothetical protein
MRAVVCTTTVSPLKSSWLAIRYIIINLSHLGRMITISIPKYYTFDACVITWAANTDVGAMLLPNVPERPPRTNFK